MQRKLMSFFNRSNTYSLPSQWATQPLPTAPVKRPVGRPKKRLRTDEATSSRLTTEMNADVSAAVTVPVSVDAVELPAPAEQHVAASAAENERYSAADGADPLPSSSRPTSPTQSRPTDSDAGCNDAAPKQRGKYKAYSVKEKEAVVQEAKQRGIRATARDKCIAVSTLLGRMKGDFCEVQAKTKRGARCAGGGRKLTTGNYDQIIFKWILEQRELHIPVSRQAIQDFARRPCTPDIPGFTASNGWLNKFMQRHQLSLRSRTSLSQKLPGDLEEKVTSFHKFLHDLRVEDEYDDKIHCQHG